MKRFAAVLLVFAVCTSVPHAAEDETEDSSAGLPEKYASDYLIGRASVSPNKKFAVMYPTEEPAPDSEDGDFIVALQPFAVLGKLETQRPYFKNENHGGLSVEWSSDGAVALVTLHIKWGPGDIFVVELSDRKMTRATNLLAKMHHLLQPDFKQAKADPYNDTYDFVFGAGEEPICTFEETGRIKIVAEAATDPKGASKGRVWLGRLEAVWDIKEAKFISQKVTRLFAGAGRGGEE